MDGFDSDTSEDEPASAPLAQTQEFQRAPSERHSFLFSHNLGSPSPDLRELHPLPSQVPFLLNIFFENVNTVFQIVHGPTISKMVRDSRNDGTSLTPANEALMFSIYYSAITSMEEDDVSPLSNVVPCSRRKSLLTNPLHQGHDQFWPHQS